MVIVTVSAPEQLDKKDRDRLLESSTEKRQSNLQLNKKALTEKLSVKAYKIIAIPLTHTHTNLELRTLSR
jgi:hypothetical protein